MTRIGMCVCRLARICRDRGAKVMNGKWAGGPLSSAGLFRVPDLFGVVEVSVTFGGGGSDEIFDFCT